MNLLSLTKVILVEPSGPLNLGSVARLCKNFGVNELRLVNPQCSKFDPEAKKMAVHGKEILENSKTFNSLIDAIADCKRVIASAGRIEKNSFSCIEPNTAFEELRKKDGLDSLGLVFGREDRGLSNKELELAHCVLSIPTEPSYPSLNLSHAVSIVLNDLKKTFKNKSLENYATTPKESLASPKDLNNYILDAEALLLEIGFLHTHTAKARMSKIRKLLTRAEIRSQEIALLRGMVHQIRWAIRSEKD